MHFLNAQDVIKWIKKNPIKDMFVLIKASRGINLEILKQAL